MSLEGRSLVAMRDLSNVEIVEILDVADGMALGIGFDDPATRVNPWTLDRILATLFFEPSTRTRLSFESAMLRLGGQVLGFADPGVSSAKKGESLADTIRMASGYADIIVQRHPLAGSARVAAEAATVPFINGGDGAHEHPTQTLTDLFCIRRAFGKLDGLKVGLCGDLKYGRTVHSLAPVMARLGSQVVCIAPDELRMPAEVLAQVKRLSGGTGFPPVGAVELPTLEDALPDLDLLYMTRVQKERFDDPAVYERVKGAHILTPDLMELAPQQMIVLHPLPRVDEIAVGVDQDPRARYFQQAAGGVPVRMALIALLLGTEMREAPKGPIGFGAAHPAAKPEPDATERPAPREERIVERATCHNPKCITGTEAYLEALVYEDEAGEGLRCGYCEERI